MEIRSIQENGRGSHFVFIPKDMMDELGLEKASSVVIILNADEKRMEIYPQAEMEKRAGL